MLFNSSEYHHVRTNANRSSWTTASKSSFPSPFSAISVKYRPILWGIIALLSIVIVTTSSIFWFEARQSSMQEEPATQLSSMFGSIAPAVSSASVLAPATVSARVSSAPSEDRDASTMFASAIVSANAASAQTTDAGSRTNTVTPMATHAATTSADAGADDTAECTGKDFTKTTLKLVKEETIIGLFANAKGEHNFEASDVIHRNGNYYVVSDDIWSVAQLQHQLSFNSEDNFLVDPVIEHPPPADANIHTENGYEAFFFDHDEQVFSGVIEAVANIHVNAATGELQYHAEVEELRFDHNLYTVTRTCKSDYIFEDSNLGFEGAIRVKSGDKSYMLGLCESNHCKGGSAATDSGNGRVVVLERMIDEANGGKCTYTTIKTIAIPAVADFRDYSAIAISKEGSRIAITSQEDAKVFVGELDIARMEFVDGGDVFNFPRDNDCRVQYCNVEGVDFLNDHMIVTASDKMKSKGRQDFRCKAHDQSIAVFVIP